LAKKLTNERAESRARRVTGEWLETSGRSISSETRRRSGHREDAEEDAAGPASLLEGPAARTSRADGDGEPEPKVTVGTWRRTKPEEGSERRGG
jgi:hypothetical protein